VNNYWRKKRKEEDLEELKFWRIVCKKGGEMENIVFRHKK
jgi:hypothetical protein